jgi:hypothetical protein
MYGVYLIFSSDLSFVTSASCMLLLDTLVVTDVPLPCEIYGLSRTQYPEDRVTHLAFLLSFVPLPYAPFSAKGHLASEMYDL